MWCLPRTASFRKFVIFPTMRDELGLVDEFPIVIRFSNTWSDHGFWAGVSADGTNARAETVFH